ncbi:WD40-repeat-containing domain protein, partial [Jimgerdemannia flammicorona]
TVLYECKGHQASVESVAVDPSKQHFATASWDSTIKIWTSSIPTEDETDYVEDARHKRRKTHKTDDRKSKSAASTLEGHVGPVSSVVFDSQDANALYSAGWDHSVRIWDVEQRVNVSTKVMTNHDVNTNRIQNCEKVVYGIAHSPHSKLLASGHADKTVRLWDPRADDVTVVKLTLISHTLWVPTVSWSPTSAYMLVSGSYDGTCKLWDIRSKAPVYTIAAPLVAKGEATKKVFTVDWEGERILSGGEDCQLRIHSAKM